MEMKTVFISGASRGLGASIARVFASNKYNVIINYNKSEWEANRLKEALESKYNIKCFLYKCDVSNEFEVKDDTLCKVSKDIVVKSRMKKQDDGSVIMLRKKAY